MKKLIAIAICSLPVAVAPTVFAQTDNATPPATSQSPAPSANSSQSPATSANSPTSDATSSSTAGATAGNTNANESVPASVSSTDWSVQDGIIGQTVYNEADDRIGNITDATVSTDGEIKSLVVGAGGFLGMGEHNVAIPFSRIQKQGDRFILAGYTKDQLKELPEYESPQKARTDTGATGMPPAAGGGAGSPGGMGATGGAPATGGMAK